MGTPAGIATLAFLSPALAQFPLLQAKHSPETSLSQHWFGYRICPAPSHPLLGFYLPYKDLIFFIKYWNGAKLKEQVEEEILNTFD